MDLKTPEVAGLDYFCDLLGVVLIRHHLQNKVRLLA